jgi:hypothetical protein
VPVEEPSTASIPDIHANCRVRVLCTNHSKVTPLVTAARQSNVSTDRGARALFVKQRLPV